MAISRGATTGLIGLGIVFYLNVLGLPRTFGEFAVPVFSIFVGFLALLFMRPRAFQTPFTPPQLAINGTIFGLIVGLGTAATVLWFGTLHGQGVSVNKWFSQVLPEHTAAWTGFTRPEIQAGADFTIPMLVIVGAFTAAGLIGALLNLLFTPKGSEVRDRFMRSQTFRYLLIALPLIFFLSFVLVDSDFVNVFGARENVFALVLIFLFLAFAPVAWRNARLGLERVILGSVLLGLILLLPVFTDLFQTAVLGKIAIFFMVGLGLNIVLGFAGLLDLGYVAFFAIGAYTYGMLSAPQSWVLQNVDGFVGVNFWMGLVIALGVGLLMGLLLGTPLLRLRGDYLAIVTLGFGEIVRLLLTNMRGITGGPGGVLNIPPPRIGELSLGNPMGIYYLALFFAGILAYIAVRLRDSRTGRAWIAIREDQDVAQAMGINLVTTKLLAFAVGASFAAAAGALYATQQVNIFPDNFRLETTIDIVSLVIIGGLGSIEGVLLGAIVLIGMPELLRGVSEYRIVAFGALLVIMMILRPEGLLPSARVQLELHESERSQDEWLKAQEEAEEAAIAAAEAQAEAAALAAAEAESDEDPEAN